MSKIKIINAALDELKDGEVILRGVVTPESMVNIKTGDYQREILPLTTLSDLVEVIGKGGSVPDIELGMRGERFKDKDGVFTLEDDVYVVDGLQRVSAALHVSNTTDVKPHLGAHSLQYNGGMGARAFPDPQRRSGETEL